MAKTIVIKIRDGQVEPIIADEPVRVIVANYDVMSSREDPYGSPCYIYVEDMFHAPDEVQLFEDVLRRRRKEMLNKGGHHE